MNLRDEIVNQHARRQAETIERELLEMAAAKLYGWRLVVIDNDFSGRALGFKLMRVPPGVSLPHGKRLVVYDLDADTEAALADR